MDKLLKNNFRYIYKNKIIMAAVFILLTIVVMIFAAFTNISHSINKTYNNVTKNYNLHNIVINENYSQDTNQAIEQKKNFENELSKLGVQFREFNSFNVNNPEKNEIYKLVEYIATYSIDRLDVFEQDGLPTNPDYKNYVLPISIDFENIINDASKNLTIQTSTSTNKLARQKLVYFMNKTNIQVVGINKNISTTWEYIKSNPDYDPLFPGSTSNSELKQVSNYLFALLDSTNNKYSPIIIRRHKIIFDLSKFNNNIPITGTFEDPYSYLAIISNGYFDANNKKVYSYTEFQKNILLNPTEYENNNELNFFNSNDPNKFKDIKSIFEISSFIDSIDDQYKIYINDIPYLIVGTGITPDFIYPIISFENTIPNPSKEAIVYTNKNGYYRTETSFESSVHEEFLLAKYTGKLTRGEILNKIEHLSRQYMNWPDNVKSVFWYNDLNNKLSPTALRIDFISQIIVTFVSIVIFLTIFMLILTIFIIVLFIKRYVNQNRNVIGIAISNGINRQKILLSMSIAISTICFLVAPIGLLLANVLQVGIFDFLKNYWFLTTKIDNLNGWWYPIVIVVCIGLLISITFTIGNAFLKETTVSLLKPNTELKINKLYILYRSLISKTNIMYKFRSSIIFSSLTKIFFITFLMMLSISSITFAISSANKMNEAYAIEVKTNSSKFSIDLFTPTSQGGQYFGIPNYQIGNNFVDINNNEIMDVNINKGYYSSIYKNTPIFRSYPSILWSSANDSSLQKTDIMYTLNKMAIQPLLNHYFGIGTLGTNPWNFTKSFLPINQIYASNNFSLKLSQKILSDIRPYNQAFFNNINNNIPIQPIYEGNNANANVFPSSWVIQNFNQVNDYESWSLNYNNDSNIGIINASEIFKVNQDNQLETRWLSADQVLSDINDLANILNLSYLTYGTEYNSEQIPSNLEHRLYPKYYPNLFTQQAINNIRVEDNLVKFDVDVNNNDTKLLITPRSIYLKYFLQKVEITDSTINNDLILDPLDKDSILMKKYGYKVKNAISVSGLGLRAEFIKFFLTFYKDPSYINNFYKILNNITILNNDTDEPYVYVNGLYKNDENVKLIGIQPNSKFINLENNKNEKMNNLLFENNKFIPIIINEYTAKKYNLKINDVLDIKTINHVDRYKYKYSNDSINIFKDNSLNIIFKDGNIEKYIIVGINNTGNESQFYISINNAQKILGLATNYDYLNSLNTTTTLDDNLVVGMNNRLNSFGGFNGIFTSSISPSIATNAVMLYSASGLYPGLDSWIESAESINLIKNTLKDTNKIKYLANALEMSTNDLISLQNEIINNQNLTINDFARKIINVFNIKYGKMAFNTIFENINSIEQQQNMFNQIGKTLDEAMLSISSLLICLSLVIIILIASIVISDLAKLTGILTTLGYGNSKNASLFFSIFMVALLFSIGLSVPITLWLNLLFQEFIFNLFALYVVIPFNWMAFIFASLLFAGVIGIIFWLGLRWFKKNKILDVLKW